MPPSLAKRLLSPNHPLPPLLDSPDLTAELYDFIALALRAYVSPWWSKISRYDKDLLPHITHILTHVIRALHRRIQRLDLPQFLLHDTPVILAQHCRDYRNAAAKMSTAYANGGSASTATLFAHLQPHMAISPDGSLDPEYYRQIVDVILKVTLPPEDYEPDAERIIIREVIIKVLLSDIVPTITQPWFIHKCILDLIDTSEEPIYISPPVPATFSFHTLLVIILSALQSFSGMCLALIHSYKQAITTIKLVQQSPPRTPPPISPTEASIPASRPVSIASVPSDVSSNSSATPTPEISFNLTSNFARPPLILLSELTSAQTRFASSILLTTISMLAAAFTPFLDKLLPHLLASFLSPALLLNITRAAKRNLFPNGYPGPQPPEPTPEEQAEIRARLVAWRSEGAAAILLPVLLGPDSPATVGAALDTLNSAQCNTHLLVFLLDSLLLGLFPELGGATIP